MQIPYTYWKEPDGWFVGYWNDYPDFPRGFEPLTFCPPIAPVRPFFLDGTDVCARLDRKEL